MSGLRVTVIVGVSICFAASASANLPTVRSLHAVGEMSRFPKAFETVCAFVSKSTQRKRTLCIGVPAS
jgi:hypothetical protein